MSSRGALTPAIFFAAMCFCLPDTSEAFGLVHGIANINRGNNNWRRVGTPNKEPMGSSGSKIVRLPRVPSAKDHAETARARSCPLRLHDVFEELAEVSLRQLEPQHQYVPKYK